MPSLLNTTVSKNYGRMTPQQSYGTGINFTNFSTRNLRFISVNVTGGTNDLTKGADGVTGDYTESLSLYSNAIRAIQTIAEIHAVFIPSATTFVVLISDDTTNDSDVGSNQPTGWGDAEAAIGACLNTGATVLIKTGTWAGDVLTFA